MRGKRDPERYAELLLLLDAAAAARTVLEGIEEDAEAQPDQDDVRAALEPLRSIGRVAPGALVAGGRGRELRITPPGEAAKAMQEFRSGALIVDFSGEERDELDRVVGAVVLLELEDPREVGSELVRFREDPQLAKYQAEWGIVTVPEARGILARLDLDFTSPQRFSLRLLFDVTLHQWALGAMEMTGRCAVAIRDPEGHETRIRVRAPRSAQLTAALTVVRLLDPVPHVAEVV